MSRKDLADRKSINKAIKKFDSLGRERFLKLYGFGKAREYFLSHKGID